MQAALRLIVYTLAPAHPPLLFLGTPERNRWGFKLFPAELGFLLLGCPGGLAHYPDPLPSCCPPGVAVGGSGTGNRAQGLHTHLLAGLAELGAPPWLALSTCRSGNTAISSTGVCGCASELGRWTLVTPTRRGSACQCPIPQGGSAGWAVTVHKAARDLSHPHGAWIPPPPNIPSQAPARMDKGPA